MDYKETFKDAVIRSTLERDRVASRFHRFMLHATLMPEAMSREAGETFKKLLDVENRWGIIPRVKELQGDAMAMNVALHREFNTATEHELPVWLTDIMSEVTDLSEVSSGMKRAFETDEAANPPRFGLGHRSGGNEI